MAKGPDAATVVALVAAAAAFGAAVAYRREIGNVVESAGDIAEAATEAAREAAAGSGPWRNPDAAYLATGMRGLRNNNPGNLKKSGSRWLGKVDPTRNTDATFEQFYTMPFGVRAAVKLLETYRDRYGLNTVREIIERYAPPGRDSNPVDAYREAVAREVGVTLDQPLDDSDETYRKLAVALFRFENGGKLPTRDDLNAGFALAGV